jgi:hypothetical protein
LDSQKWNSMKIGEGLKNDERPSLEMMLLALATDLFL